MCVQVLAFSFFLIVLLGQFQLQSKTSPIFQNFEILIFLGDGYDSMRSLLYSSSDSLPLRLGYFPTSYVKITCMKKNCKISENCLVE